MLSKLRTTILLAGGGLSLLIAAPACATEPAAPLLLALEKAGADQAAVYVSCPQALMADADAARIETAIQYLPELRQLLAWRVLSTPAGPCVAMDWPQSIALSPRQASGLRILTAAPAPLRSQRQSSMMPGADVRAAPERAGEPFWAVLPQIPLAADRSSLPWCPQTLPGRELQPATLDDTIAALVLRVRPYRCKSGSRPTAGSGVLLSPDLALTAAHVVLTSEGVVCDRYRLVPGGRRYSDPPAAPFGTAFVSRAFLSERAGWNQDADSAPDLNEDYGDRTAHDFAFLMLDEPARLPGSLAWPRLRFDAAPLQPGLRVLRAGYGVIGPAGRIAPGSAVNLFGQSACTRGTAKEPFHRFALWMSAGASGGPVWRWAAPEDPFELLSLAVRMETHREHFHETLGPRFDYQDYQRLLGLMSQPQAERKPAQTPVRRHSERPSAPREKGETRNGRRETARSKIRKLHSWRVMQCANCDD